MEQRILSFSFNLLSLGCIRVAAFRTLCGLIATLSREEVTAWYADRRWRVGACEDHGVGFAATAGLKACHEGRYPIQSDEKQERD